MRLFSYPAYFFLISFLTGCSCCLYFNHYFNAEKAFSKGIELREERLKADSTGTALDSTQRQKETDQFERAIEKGSKILKKYPKDLDYKPDVIFIIGQSFYYLDNCEKAIIKYNELERYFPEYGKTPETQYLRAYCYYVLGDLSIANFSLRNIINQDPKHNFYQQAVELLAKISYEDNLPDQAIANILEILKNEDLDDYLRAKLRYQLGKLYHKTQQWSRASKEFQNPLLDLLDIHSKYDAEFTHALCLKELAELDSAIALARSLTINKEYEQYIQQSYLLLGELFFEAQLADSVIVTLEPLTHKSVPSQIKSKAFFQLGETHNFILNQYVDAKTKYLQAISTLAESPWRKTAQDRIDAINRLLELRKKKSISAKDRLITAETFLFQLDNVDSAVHHLDDIISDTKKATNLEQAKAAYAKAFILEEYRGDSVNTDSLYKMVIANYPGTEFAKQAERNLGKEIISFTREDSAHASFLMAESLYFSLDGITGMEFTQFDSLEGAFVLQYDSVEIKFPNTSYGAKSLFTVAWINEHQRADYQTARKKYQSLVKKYPNSEYAEIAKYKLEGKVDITPRKIDSLKRALEKLEREERKQQIRKKKVDKRRQKLEELEEILNQDYNDMYEIGQ